MSWTLDSLWLVPLLPLAVAGVLAFTPVRCRRHAAPLAISALAVGFLISCAALWEVAAQPDRVAFKNFTWFEFGANPLRLGWVLDPLSSVMLVMVTFVGAWIFTFSAGYMAHDARFTRFYCYLSLFAAAMLGVVLSNNLLMLFMCWEVMGLASYLLIGFWHHKPSAAAAARKAFITTRIGDLGLLLGMLWLYSETGTLLFYDNGTGCLEANAVTQLASKVVGAGMVASTAISLLILCGAIGKSGQLPLHVWLPDAMEGPTPVSALIHAATMVAAGVFLMARMHPVSSALPPSAPAPAALAAAHPGEASSVAKSVMNPPAAAAAAAAGPGTTTSHAAETDPHQASTALQVMAWIGSLTALFAALIAVAQTDIKRILAYSTISQLGYMFLGLATGGVAVGMFHLITHAFFKALLFLGAGSVIHGCHEEQDIRHMGGLRRLMPVTFATYAIGMMALCGVPLVFSGFWSKDEILHSALLWGSSKWPFLFALMGAFLTALYMTRQIAYVFLGPHKGHPSADEQGHRHLPAQPHESSATMTRPLIVLAACAILLSLVGTPLWPWFHGLLTGHAATFESKVDAGVLAVMLLSSCVVACGLGLGAWIYIRTRAQTLQADAPDPLELRFPDAFAVLREKFHIDRLYELSFCRWMMESARFSSWLDRESIEGVMRSVRLFGLGLAWLARLFDEFVANLGFNEGCTTARRSGRAVSGVQDGQVQRYLKILGGAVVVMGLWILWK